jgi:hypothetical protein
MTERQYVIPTRPGMGRGLVNHDEQSKQYRAVDLIDQTKPHTRHWRRGRAYDQGATSQCVAYTGVGILNTAKLSAATPYEVRSRLVPEQLYRGAQANDQWPGDQYDGTSGLGLCRYLAITGQIHEYRWIFGIDDALLTLSWLGPLGIGVNWLSNMWETDSDGYIHVSGDPVGGHEVEVTGIDVRRQHVIITNSWGTGWGRNGKAFLSFDDLGKLLDADGDGFVITA